MEKYNTLILTIILCTNFVTTIQNQEELIDVISEFFTLQKQPTKVIAFLCWENEYILKLTKRMNAANIMISTNCKVSLQNDLLPTFHPGEHQFYLLDNDCASYKYILKTAYRQRLLEPPYRWLILGSANLTNLEVCLNTRIYLLEKYYYKIVSIYKYSQNDLIMYDDVATWNGTEMSYYNEISDARNRSDLNGTPINISLVIQFKESLEHLTDFRKREHDALSKHNYILATHVAEVLNLTSNFIIQNTLGYMDNKTRMYNGMLGDIQTKISEIGATASLIDMHKIAFADMVSETTPTYTKFIFRSPPLSAVSNVFYLPFNDFVWLASIALLFVIFFVIYLIIKWEWSNALFQDDIVPNKMTVLQPRITDVMQMEIGAIFQQGAEAEPKSDSGRIVTFFVLFTLMFLYVSYSANIVALLQSTTDAIKTLDDLYESKMELAVDNVTSLKFYFENTNGKTQELIRKNRISVHNKYGNYINVTEGIEKMRLGYYAFFAEVDKVYKIISRTFLEHEKCGLNEIGYWSLSNPVVVIKKNSTYKELIKIAYTKLHERGLRMRSYKQLYLTKPTCQNQGANFISVSINDCYFAIMSFGIGIVTSLLVFILEHSMKNAQKINNVISNIFK